MKSQGFPLSKAFHPMVLVFGCALSAISCYAQDGSGTWANLPDETVIAVRIPDGAALAEAARGTKFGAVMFSEKRKAALLEALESDESGAWAKTLANLEEYNLTIEDLWGALAGETAYAVVMDSKSGDEPIFAGFGWLDVDPTLVDKLYDALAKIVDEQGDAEHPVTRIDLDSIGEAAMQLQIPSITVDYTADFDLPADYDDLSEEEQESAWRAADEAFEESAVETTTYHTVIVCKSNGRLMLAHSFQSAGEDAAGDAAEQLAERFGRFVAAQLAGPGEFVSRVTSDASSAPVMALEGLPVLEMLGDLAPLVEMLKTADLPGAPADPEQFVRLFGLESVGAFAVRYTVDGPIWRSAVSLAMPAPRQGLMRLLDQEMLPIEPPQWVPADVVQYHQIGFDLGAAYEIVKEEVTREFPESTAAGFEMVETQLQVFTQTSLTDILNSLGNRHTVLSFGIDADAFMPDESGNDSEALTERMALVWRVEDEAVWQQLFKALTPFAGMLPGTEFTEEQGFSGWRVQNEQVEGGLFLGKGKLVLGVGSGVIESVLSSLNNPPTGEDSLRGSKVFAQAGEIINLEPAMVAEVTDGNRYWKMTMDALDQPLSQLSLMLDQMDGEGDGVDGGLQLMSRLGEALVPTSDEAEGMMGVITSRWEINDDGMYLETAQEMPVP